MALRPVMKLNNMAHYWSKSWPLTFLLFAVVFLSVFSFADFELVPGVTDMIGEATLNNINVSARVSFYFKALLLFLSAGLLSIATVVTILKLPNGDVVLNIINLCAKISLVLCLQQIFFNEVSYFFGFVFCFSLTGYFALFNNKNSYRHAFILVAGLVLSFFASRISVQLLLLFIAQIVAYLVYTKYSSQLYQSLDRKASRQHREILISSFAIGCILSYLLIMPEIDLSIVLIRFYNERNFSSIPLELYWLPLLCSLIVYFVLRKLVNIKGLANTGWLCFISLFTALQFSDHYLPSLLMLISFFIIGAIKKEKMQRVIELYSLTSDLLATIAFFYLVNQFFFLLNSGYDYLLPLFFLTKVSLRQKYIHPNNRARYYKYLLAVILTPFILLLSQEIVMLLNQRSVFIGKVGYIFFVSSFFLLVILFLIRWEPQRFSSVVSILFAFAVGGAAIYNAYHPIFFGTVNLFEEASAAMAIKRTYLYNETPLLQHFSPHNLNDYLTGLLYTWINNDISLAYKIYTCIYALFYLVYYFFLLHFFKSRFYAILWIFFSATLYVLFPFYHAVVVLFFLILYNYFSRNYSLRRLLSMSPLLLLLLLFRPDTGFALFITGLISIPLMAVFFTDGWLKAERLCVALILYTIAFLGLIALLFDPSEIWGNAQLIIGYLQSSQSWGYAVLSKIVNYKFRIHYFVFPLVVVFILAYTVLHAKPRSKQIVFHRVALIFFCIYYLVNFQRGLVRHSFVELTDDNISSFVFLIISVFISGIVVRRMVVMKFAFVFLVSSFLLVWIFKFPRPPVLRSLYTASVDKIRTESLPVFSNEKINRFRYMPDSELQNSGHAVFVFSRIDQLRNYYRSRDISKVSSAAGSLERSNDPRKRYQTLLSLVNNKKIDGYVDEVCYEPLSGYFLNEKPVHFFNQGFHCYHNSNLQRKFVDEMLANNVRYVLMSHVSTRSGANALDHVPHSIRHYYTVQHIYDYYKPQLIVDGMALWVRDSVNVNSNPLFSQSYYGDSVYHIQQRFSGHQRTLVTVFGVDSISGDVVIFNNSIAIPVSFYNKNEKKAFVLVDSAFHSIETVKLGSFADSIRLEGYDYFPDLFSSIPQTYHLKLLPYVLGQSSRKNAVNRPIGFKVVEENIISAKLDTALNTKGAALRFVLSNNSKASETVTVQYYKSNSFLGEYTFLLKQGADIPYLLQAASQPNWNFGKPDVIKLKLPGKSYLSKLSIIYKDELSY